MEKLDEIFTNDILFITTQALPGETARSILENFDRPNDLVILQLSKSFYMIYLKSKEEEVKQLESKALEEVKKEETAVFKKNKECFPSSVYDPKKTVH